MAVKKRRAVLVTGAAKRIGRAVAIALAEEGYSVIGHYNYSKKEIDSLGQQIRNKGVSFYYVRYDLSENPAGLMHKCNDIGIELCGLVNNASIFEPCSLIGNKSMVDKILMVNAYAPLELMKGFSEYCNNGFVINIVDANIDKFNRRFQAYRVSKRLLLDFSLEMAALLAPSIRVNVISPGAVLPSKFSTVGAEKLLRGPMGNGGKLVDIVDAVIYLIRSKNITGQLIYADGGLHLTKRLGKANG